MSRDDKTGEESSLPVSRRGFVVRAGQMGALTVLGSRLGAEWAAMPVHMPPARAAAITDLYSGLRWRMLGPQLPVLCGTSSQVSPIDR